MIPEPLRGVYDHVERVQADMDPDERVRALSAMDEGLRDLTGRVAVYLHDARLQIEGTDTGREATGGE
jgi:hypothetical protein